MGRNAKIARAYNYVVTGIDSDGHRFRLETNTLGLAQTLTPWRGTLWTVEQDGTRRAMINYRHGQPVA